jgi:hypothetical protein
MIRRIELCKRIVARYANRNSDVINDVIGITKDEVSILWYCKTLNNIKVALTTTLPDGLHYEITYNGDTGEYSLDVYKHSVTIAHDSKGDVIWTGKEEFQ